MPVLDDWTWDWDRPQTDIWTPSSIWPGYTCVAPIVKSHTDASVFTPVSTAGKRFTAQTNVGLISTYSDGYHPGSCGVLRVQLADHLLGQSETEGSEGWYAWSVKWPTSPGAIFSWEGLGFACSGYHVTHPGNGMFGWRCPNNGQYALQMRVGHCPSPAGSGTSDTFGTNGVTSWDPIGPTSGVATTNKNGYNQTPIILGPGGVAPLTLNVWHDFVMHVLWKSTTNGVVEIWHREEGQVGSSPLYGFTKVYTNIAGDSALIAVAPHATLQWNIKYGAPGELGSPPADLDFQCYRGAPGPFFQIYTAGVRRRGSFNSAITEFVDTSGGGGGAGGLPNPAVNHSRLGNSAGAPLTAVGVDGKSVLLRDFGPNLHTIDKAYAYLKGPVSGGSQPFKVPIYDNDGAAGLPGTLLGMSDEVVIAQGAAEGWYEFPFTTPVTGVTGPTYFGRISGGPGSGQIGFLSATGQGWFKSDTYSDGPANPFGATPTVINLEIAVVVDFTTTTDVTAPQFVSASVRSQSPETVDIILDEAVAAGFVPSTAAFTVTVDGISKTINSPVVLSGAVVSLTMAAPIAYPGTVLVSYVQPGSNKLQDAAGNLVASFSNQAVFNPPPAFIPGVRIAGALRGVGGRGGGGTRRAQEGGGG